MRKHGWHHATAGAVDTHACMLAAKCCDVIVSTSSTVCSACDERPQQRALAWPHNGTVIWTHKCALVRQKEAAQKTQGLLCCNQPVDTEGKASSMIPPIYSTHTAGPQAKADHARAPPITTLPHQHHTPPTHYSQQSPRSLEHKSNISALPRATKRRERQRERESGLAAQRQLSQNNGWLGELCAAASMLLSQPGQ